MNWRGLRRKKKGEANQGLKLTARKKQIKSLFLEKRGGEGSRAAPSHPKNSKGRKSQIPRHSKRQQDWGAKQKRRGSVPKMML